MGIISATVNEWYTSKMVLFVLLLAFLFVAVHVLLLARVLMKVWQQRTDSARACVGERSSARARSHRSANVACRWQVHTADSRVLLYPLAGLSASAVVGGFAIAIHRMSEPPKRD